MAWLDASHRRRAADPGRLQVAGVGKAASAESHRHPAGVSPKRLDAGQRPPPEGNRRLSSLDARTLSLRCNAWVTGRSGTGRVWREFPDACLRRARLTTGLMEVVRRQDAVPSSDQERPLGNSGGPFFSEALQITCSGEVEHWPRH